jgi:hypothetical protein
MVVFDATTLMLVLWPNAPAPKDPTTDRLIERAAERVEYLVKTLEKRKTKIIIPTPALSEVLVRAGRAGPDYVAQIERAGVFCVESFDTRAAIEVALLTRDAIDSGDKRSGGEGVWAKIKYDRQIVAIAKVSRSTTIYTDDKNLKIFASSCGLSVIGLGDCPLPPEKEIPPLLKIIENSVNRNTETDADT